MNSAMLARMSAWNWVVILDRIGVTLMFAAVVGLKVAPLETASVLTAAGGFALFVRAMMPLAKKLADYTATRVDNDFLMWLSPRLDLIVGAMDVLRRGPRFTVGPSLRTQPLASVTGSSSTIPPMKPISSPPGPVTTLRPWPTPVDSERGVTPIELPSDREPK